MILMYIILSQVDKNIIFLQLVISVAPPSPRFDSRPPSVTHHSSSQDDRASSPCRCGRGSSSIPPDCGCSQSGCSGIWWWRQPRRRADAGFRRLDPLSCIWGDQETSQSDPGQRRQTCQCQGQGDQEDRGVLGFLEDPERRRRRRGCVWNLGIILTYLFLFLPSTLFFFYFCSSQMRSTMNGGGNATTCSAICCFFSFQFSCQKKTLTACSNNACTEIEESSFDSQMSVGFNSSSRLILRYISFLLL